MSEWHETEETVEDPFDGPVGGYDETDEEEVLPNKRGEVELEGGVEELTGRADWEKPDYEQILEDTDVRTRDQFDGSGEELMQPSRYTYLPVYSYTLGHISIDSFAWGRDAYQDNDIDHESQVGEPITLGDTGKRFTWWEDDSLMAKYPYLFINPVITAEYMWRMNNTAYHLLRCRPGEQFILTDSGGFQMVSRESGEVMDEPGTTVWDEAKINPTDLAWWQVENADGGLVLDMPPYGKSSKDDQNDKEAAEAYTDWRNGVYEERLAKTYDNAVEMHEAWESMPEKKTEDFFRMGVVQGQPDQVNTDQQYESLQNWHETLEEAGEYEGWAMKPRPVDNVAHVALHLGYAVDRLIDYPYIHVLQLGNMPMKQLCMFASKQSGQWITSDAGSWAAATLWRQVFLPSLNSHHVDTPRTTTDNAPYHNPDMPLYSSDRPKLSSRTVTISPRDDDERESADQEATRFDMYPCRCEVCTIVRDEKGIGYITQDDSDSRRNASLCLHNLQLILQDDRTLQSLMRAHWDTLLDDVEFDDKSVRRYGNEYWHTLGTLLTEIEMYRIYKAMQFIKDCHEDGIEEANKKVTFNWYQDGGRWSWSKSAIDW